MSKEKGNDSFYATLTTSSGILGIIFSVGLLVYGIYKMIEPSPLSFWVGPASIVAGGLLLFSSWFIFNGGIEDSYDDDD